MRLIHSLVTLILSAQVAAVDLPPVAISGNVTDSEGYPLPGALVTFRTEASGVVNVLASTEADGEGQYSLRDVTSRLDQRPFMLMGDGGRSRPSTQVVAVVTASSPDRGTMAQRLEINFTTSEQRLDFTLPSACRHVGRLQFEDGRPAADVKIALTTHDFELGSTFPYAEAVTEPDGSYTFPDGHFERIPVYHAMHPVGLYLPLRSAGRNGDLRTLTFASGGEPYELRVLGRVSGEPQQGLEVWLGNQLTGRLAIRTATEISGRISSENLIHHALRSRRVTQTYPERLEYSEYVTQNAGSPERYWSVPEPGTIAGRMLRIDDDSPVANQRFLVSSHHPLATTEGVTDAEGHFVVEGVLLSRSGYLHDARVGIRLDFAFPDGCWLAQRESGASDVEVEEHESLTDITLRLQPLSDLTITVFDPRGVPLPGATIYLQASISQHSPAEQPHGMTDAQGRVTLPRPERTPWTRAVGHHPDHPVILSGQVSPEVSEVTIVAPETVEVEILVLGPDSEPLASHQVIARHVPSYSTGQSSPSGHTDQHGMIRLTLPRMSHTLRGSDDRLGRGDLIAERQIDLTDWEPGDRIVLSLHPPRDAEIAGRVIDVAGSPIEGALVWHNDFFATLQRNSTVQIIGEQSAEVPTLTEVERRIRTLEAMYPPTPYALTDREGRFQLSIPLNRWTSLLSALAPSHEPVSGNSIPAHLGEFDTEIVMVPKVQIVGRAETSTGEPATDATWQFLTWDEGGRWRLSQRFEAPSVRRWMAIGVYPPREPMTYEELNRSMAFPPEAHGHPVRVIVRTLSGEAAMREFPLGIEAGQSHELGTMRLEPCAALAGHVTATDGTPIEDARVEIANDWRADPDRLHALSPVQLTDAGGTFTFPAIPSSEWQLRVTALEHASTELSIVHPGDSPLEISLAPMRPGSARIQVLGHDGRPMAGQRVTVTRRFAFGADDTQRDILFTDAEGFVFLDEIPPGFWAVGAQWVGWLRSQRFSVDGNHRDIVLDFSDLVEIRGRLRRGDGALVGQSLYISGSEPQVAIPLLRNISGTGTNGTFERILEPGTHRVFWGIDPFDLQFLTEFEATEDMTLDLNVTD